jgi:DNA-binding protein HU-beta
MNKGELIAAIAEKSSVTQKTAEQVLNGFLVVVVETVSNGDDVAIAGFGTFKNHPRKEREGRNPKTNERMTIPATKVPVFHAGKTFKDSVSKG